MACPYFRPSLQAAERSAQALFATPQSAMLPLGDSYSGECSASPDRLFHPGLAVSRALCNLGYARGECEHFPGGESPDAVRFTISADLGDTLRLYYVIERNHHPFAHGPLEYSIRHSRFSPEPSSAAIDLQARAYIASYLYRKAGAPARP